MRKVRRFTALLLVTLLLTLTACAKKTEPPPAASVKLDDVRQQAAKAFDGTTSAAERRTAADEAMRLLLALLGQPDSTDISDQEWAESPRTGVDHMVRHLDLGSGVHVYALTLPGDSLTEVRERVALQVRGSGGENPAVSELTLLPASRLLAARALQEGKAKLHVTLAMATEPGEGYVAHFQGDTSGAFKPDNAAFSGLAGEYGSVKLATQDGFLTVSLPGEWQPAFDQKQPLRLILAPEVALDWKKQYVLVDDSKFDAFALLAIAADPALCAAGKCPEAIAEKAKQDPKAAAAAAWTQANAKLTALLADEKTWSDDFETKLPKSAVSLRDQGRDLAVRILSLRAPEGAEPKAYTAVQFRVGGGIPMTRLIELPGPVTAFKATTHGGLPALLLAVNETEEPEGTLQKAGLHLFRLNAGNDWVSAEGWVGSVPESPYFHLGKSTANKVAIQWEVDQNPNFTIRIETGAQPNVTLCQFLQEDCHSLVWVSGKLHAIDVLKTQLTESLDPSLTPEEYYWRANQLALFLAAADPAEVSEAQIRSLLDLQVINAGFGTRVVAMPPTDGPSWAAVIHARGQGLVVPVQDRGVTSWEDARVLEGGGQQRLVILGRSELGYVLIAHQWDGQRWVPVDALNTKEEQNLAENARVFNFPGQTTPVRGMLIYGSQVAVEFADDGSGVTLCESAGFGCKTYGYDAGWRLYTR